MRDVLFSEPARPLVSRSTAPSARRRSRVQCDQVAVDFHDSLGATLFLLARRLDALAADERKAARRDELRRLRGLTQQALEALRGVAEAMDLVRYQDADVDRALRQIGADFARLTGICVDVRAPGPVADVPVPVRRLLLFVARRALFDVGRHSRATFVVVTLAVEPARVALELVDDGVDVAQRRPGGWQSPSPELGLAAMARALDAAGGRLTVLRGRPRGLRIRAVVPRPARSVGR